MDYRFIPREDEEKIDTTEEMHIPSLTQLSEQIDIILSKENIKELVILKQSLAEYKQEVENKIKYGTPIENDHFKASLHVQLENLLLNIIYIPNKEIRDDKLRALFRWYFEKLDHYNSLDRIRYRTDKDLDEVYREEDIPSDEILIQDDLYEREEFSKHRTEILGLKPPKDRLKEFKYKKVNPPKKFKKDEKTLANLRFNLERFHGRVGTANNSINTKNIYYATKTGQKWFSNSGIGVTNELQAIDARKEIKGGYSFNRPEYDYKKLVVEKTNIQAKNKELAEKRNQEEMRKYIDEFGKAKAKYKEEIERKYNHRNIVTTIQKTFKVDKIMYEFTEDYKSKEEEKDDKKEEKNENVEEEEKRRKESPDKNTNIKNKILYTKIININSKEESKIKVDNNENNKSNLKIYLKNDRSKLLSALEKNKDNQIPIKPDTFAFRIVDDKILQNRIKSGRICDVKEIDMPKLGYMHHYTPLSAFDYVNYEEYREEILTPKKKLERPKTASEFALRNFDKYSDNYLDLRFKMSEYKKEEIALMTELVFNGPNCGKNVDAYEHAVTMPNIVRNKNTFDNPRPQSCLLTKPGGLDKKKKRPKSKKK